MQSNSDSLMFFAINGLAFFLLWLLIWKLLYEVYLKKQSKSLEKKIEENEKAASKIVKEAEKEAKEIINNAEKESKDKFQKMEEWENKIFTKEETLDKKFEKLEDEKQKIKEEEKELEELKNEEKKTLESIAKLSEEQAKEKLFGIVEEENKKELSSFLNKYKKIKEEEAKKEATNIMVQVLPRIGMNDVSNFTVSTIDIPSEDTKWKIIWREWRNIVLFEKLTGVEVVIDDTPMVVKLSSFDPEKRFVATETLRRLISDGRINPFYIEKFYNDVVENFDDIMLEKGKDALNEVNLPMMNPEIVKMIWRYSLRYSYGQNLLLHSIEVAKISEIMANELWLDWVTAKKAWILHDIWKLEAWNGEAHAKLWWDILRKFGYSGTIVNATEWHHFDIELTDPIGWVIATADAISASRPWARFNTKELFIERMTNLEQLITSVSGIEKVNIMQAWREIVVFVNPEELWDYDMHKLIKDIWQKIEDQLDYPWAIRVVAIRETKVVDYLK